MIGFEGKVDLENKPDRYKPPFKRKLPEMTTFHHNIAWERLAELWNRLVEQQRWKALGFFVILLGESMAVAIQFVDAIRNHQEGANDIDSDLREKVGAALLWSGWNIVEGPLGDSRIDDPGRRFDLFTGNIPLDQRTRFFDIRIFNTVVESYLAQFAQHGHSSEDPGEDCPPCIMLSEDLAAEFQIMAAHRAAPHVPMTDAIADVIREPGTSKQRTPANALKRAAELGLDGEMWKIAPPGRQKGRKIWMKA